MSDFNALLSSQNDFSQTPVEQNAALNAEADNQNDLAPDADAQILPVVGLGGCAGSIGALQEFFGRIPSDLGIAYVVVVHLSPDFESQLAPILQARTKMKVVQVQNPIKVEPNCVYVIPPTYHLLMEDEHIHLSPPQQDRGKRVAVDLFFRTLATSRRSRALAVVLSGIDGDGAIGIERIKEHGGVTIAQDPDEAEYDEMPRSAIETGMVDWILGVEAMAGKISQWIDNEWKIQLPPAQETPETEQNDESESALQEVLAFVLARTGHDFSHYKRASVLRRIQRRLQVNILTTIPEYTEFLRTHPGEAGALLQDLLISVTNFFRDPEAFRTLENLIPRLFRQKKSGEALRVWVPACATGEEAYSLAILLIETAQKLKNAPEIQIFATDLDEAALRFARDGLYPATIAADVSPDRLRRFFVLEMGRYRVKKEVRERILFAHHNVLRDSPFSRLDLISCRNLLIYFGPEAQTKAFDTFHFALQPNALMFLGISESADDNPLFSAVDRKFRIYERTNAPRAPLALSTARLAPLAPLVGFSPSAVVAPEDLKTAQAPKLDNFGLSFGDLHLKLLERASPPSILLNRESQIVHLSEGAGQFLRFVGGEVSTNLLEVVHPNLRLELRAAIFRALQNGEDVDSPAIAVSVGGQNQRVSLRVRPMRDGDGEDSQRSPNFVLVIFAPADAQTPVLPASSVPDETARQLEAELTHLKTYLRSSVEQFETSTEELKASNEELQAMNEEQHSAAEELGTSREEIQAANEELTTVNAELKSKIEELARANSDLQNFMASTDIATVFLSRNLEIQRYTPRAVELFRLIPSDFGRPLGDLTHNFESETFAEDAQRVLQSLMPVEREVRTLDGEWFLERAAPYRTVEDRIDGVVLAFVNITARKNAEESLRQTSGELELQLRKFDSVISSVPDFIYTFDLDGRISYGNKAFVDLLQETLASIVGKNFYDLNYPPELATRLQRQIQQVIDSCQSLHDTALFTSAFGTRFYKYFFVPLFDGRGAVEAVAGITHDITEIKQSEENLRQSEQQLRIAIESAQMGTWVWDTTTNKVRWNERHFTLFGMEPRDELLSPQVFFDHVHPDEREQVRVLLEKAAAEQTLFEAEFRALVENGETRWMSGYGKAVEVVDGQTVRMSGVVFDINERKKNEEDLRESEELLRLATEAAAQGVWDKDYRSEVMRCSPRMFEIFGLAPTPDGTTCWETFERGILSTDLPILLKTRDFCEQNRRLLQIEHRVVRADNGQVRWLAMNERYFYEGEELVRSVGNIYDITERKQNEEALRESEERLRIALEGANLGTCDWRYAAGLMTWDEQHFRLFGMEPHSNAFPVQEFWSRFHPDDLSAIQEKMRVEIEEIGAYEAEFRIVRADNGEVRWMNDAGRVIERDENGFPTRVSNIIFDVTTRREAEEILRRDRDELEWRVEERTRDLGEALQQLRAEIAQKMRLEDARRELLKRLVNAQEDERRRISRELHDNLGQHLTAIMLGLQALKNGCESFFGGRRQMKAPDFEGLSQVVDDLMKAAHRQAWELRPAELDDMGLEVALRHFTNDWSERTGISLDFHAVGWENARLDSEIETALYRVVQEALTNVVRHAGATRVSVVLELASSGASAIIEDDGRGFDLGEAENNGRLGLLGMRERLALVQGSLEIESSPETGTTLYARAPASLLARELQNGGNSI